MVVGGKRQTHGWELASCAEGLGHLDWPLTKPASSHQAKRVLGFLRLPQRDLTHTEHICNLGLRKGGEVLTMGCILDKGYNWCLIPSDPSHQP